MKFLFAALLLASSACMAETLNDTGCTAGGVCFNPAPGIDYVAFSKSYGRVTASLDGVLYDSGLYVVPIEVAPQFTVNATLFGPSGFVTANLQVKHWTTTVNSGRTHQTVQHFELLSGSIQ